MFHRISDNVMESIGHIDSKKIFFEWYDWLKKATKEELTHKSKII